MNYQNMVRMAVIPCVVAALPVLALETTGETRIAKWKYDRQAAFLLMFDDSEPTHLKYVIPELEKRDLMGTFFIVPGAPWYDQNAWETKIPHTRMELGNHTLHHSGATNSAVAEAEIAGGQEVLHRIYPERKNPRLIVFAYPGGSPWTLTAVEKAAMLKKNHFITRPPPAGHFGGVDLKTGAALVQVVDRALTNGSMEHLSFHGVGGDWLSVSLPDFTQLLDAMAANRDKLWVTDPVSLHKYESERNLAQVQVLERQPERLRLALHGFNDPLYDEPLTLITPVPADWKKCTVTQGDQVATVSALQGSIRYEALPDGPDIVIQPVP
jgi:peptidoglycan/xylan/chitin deacetylase (PgdA/CDA1 family)